MPSKNCARRARVLPLVALAEYVGVGQNVRDWMPAPWREWHLADVWRSVPEPDAELRGNSNAASPGAKP